MGNTDRSCNHLRLGEGTSAHAERARARRGMDRVGTEIIKFDLID